MQENDSLGIRITEVRAAEALRQQLLQEIEAIPEMRHLIGEMVKDRAERARMTESFNLLSDHDTQKLFTDYIEDILEVSTYRFFARLYNGTMTVLKKTLSDRLDLIEEKMDNLKQSLMIASLHPYTWINYEVEKVAREFLATQPGMSAPLDTICKYLVGYAGVPMPYSSQVDQYRYVMGILRHMNDVREIGEFLFKLIDTEVKEAPDHVVSQGVETGLAALRASIRKLASSSKNGGTPGIC